MKHPPTPLSKSLLDMEVANYSEGLDPTYDTLGFENAEVLYAGGEWLAFELTDTDRDASHVPVWWTASVTSTYG